MGTNMQVKIALNLDGLKHHAHLVNRILKRAKEAGMAADDFTELEKRIRYNAEPLTREQVLKITAEFCVLELVEDFL